MHPLLYRPPQAGHEMPASSRNPDKQHPPTRLQTHKGPFVFSMWVEVDGKPLPVYHIEEAAEGPEGWIPVVEGKVWTFLGVAELSVH